MFWFRIWMRARFWSRGRRSAQTREPRPTRKPQSIHCLGVRVLSVRVIESSKLTYELNLIHTIEVGVCERNRAILQVCFLMSCVLIFSTHSASSVPLLLIDHSCIELTHRNQHVRRIYISSIIARVARMIAASGCFGRGAFALFNLDLV